MHGGRDSVCMVQGTSNSWFLLLVCFPLALDPWPGNEALISVQYLFIHYRSCIQQLALCSIPRSGTDAETDLLGEGARAHTCTIWGAFEARGPCPGTNMRRRPLCCKVNILPSRYSYSVMVALLHSDGGTPYLYTTARARCCNRIDMQ